MNTDLVLDLLRTEIGKKFDSENLITLINENIYIIINEVEGLERHMPEHGICKIYNLYENKEDSIIFNIYVDKNNIIAYVD